MQKMWKFLTAVSPLGSTCYGRFSSMFTKHISHAYREMRVCYLEILYLDLLKTYYLPKTALPLS